MALSIFSAVEGKTYNEVTDTYSAFISAWNGLKNAETVNLEAFKSFPQGLPGVFEPLADSINRTIKTALILLDKDLVTFMKEHVNESNAKATFKDLITSTQNQSYCDCLEKLPAEDFNACVTEFRNQLTAFDYDAIPNSHRVFFRGMHNISQIKDPMDQYRATETLNAQVKTLKAEEKEDRDARIESRTKQNGPGLR